MKKFHSFLMMAVMALVMSFTAKAATVTINVDDPNRVEVQVDWETKTLVAGDNTFELNMNTTNYVYIIPAQGALLKSVTDGYGTPKDFSGSCYLYEYPTEADYASKYVVTSIDINEARTASCKITVDNVENVGGLQANQTNESFTLVNGENEVKFIPDMESPFTLSAPYGKTFYKVTVDSVTVTENYGQWYLNVVDGSVVDIKTEFPDVEVAVNIAYASEEANGIVTAVYVDGAEVTPDADGNIMVKLGKTVELNLDATNYAIDSFTINGETPSDWYGSSSYYSFTVLEAANIVVGGHKYGTYAVTINIEHPEYVKVEDGNYNVLNLVAGENKLEVSENAASVKVTKAAGCKITSILVNGTEYSEYGYDNSYGTTINIASDSTVIDIFAEEIVYDNKAIVYIDDECYSYSYMMNATTRDQVYLVKGENKIGFNNGEEAHRLNVMTTGYGAPAAIYNNGLYVTSYSNSEWTLANGDYIKVFMNARPEELAVTFALAEGFENSVDSVTVGGKGYADWANGVNVLEGTNVSFTLTEGVTAVVLVDNKAVTADEEGNYSFTVNAATKVRIVAPAETVTPTAEGTANPFAYALSSELTEGVLKVNYSLNTDATAVTVNVLDADGNVAATAEGTTTKGSQTVDINVEDLEGSFTWEVVVAGAEKASIEEFASYMFYHPRGVDVDNNMESPAFGNVYVTEGMNSSNSKYWACDANGGLGLYIFDPQMNGIKNPNTGMYSFRGGWELNYKAGTASAADFARVRVAEDGRIFVTRMQDDGDYILVAENHETLVATDKMTSLFAGLTFDATTYKYTNAEGAFMGAANLGFDVKGSGEDLKLLALSSNANHWSYVYSGGSTDEYALGTADSLPVPTNVAALTGKYTIAPATTNVEYDDRGGIWYCQYRGTPTDAQPGLVYIDANGEEKYKDLVSRGGGGIRISPDGKQIAIASSSANPKQFSIYDLVYNEDGSIELTEKTKITHGIGTNVYDIAWDLAGNIYVCGNSGEYLKGFALPRAEAFTTKAASKYAFTIVAPEPVTVTPAAGTANPFAYALSSEVADNTLKVNYSLNTDATAVTVKVVDAEGEVVATAEGATTKGAQTVEINVAELVDGAYSWEIEVAGAEKAAMEEFSSLRFYHPRGVDVDNNMESPAFGNVYVTEGMETSSEIYYPANNGGVGLYIFTPDMEGVKNEVTGKYAFMGDLTYSFLSYGADLARVRVAEDGRIFVTRCNSAGDYILYAPSQEDLVKNNKFTSLLAGGELDATSYEYNTADGFLAAGNVGFDVKGSGEDLKMMTIAANNQVFAFNAAGSRVDEYALGEAEVLPTPTKIEALSGYTTAPQCTNVEYDDQDGVWYCQYRGAPTDAIPALIYLDANGEQLYFEGAGGAVRGGGGIRISPDGKQIAIASSKKTFSIYDIKYKADGTIKLVENTVVTHGIGTNCYDIAWDLAGNIYICGNSGEYFKGFALPRAEAFTTKAASKYEFTLDASAIETVGADEEEVEYYNLQGVKVANPEKGIFIKKQGNKTTKVVL